MKDEMANEDELAKMAKELRFLHNQTLRAFMEDLRHAYGQDITEHLSDEEVSGLYEISLPFMSYERMRSGDEEMTTTDYEKMRREYWEDVHRLRPTLLKLAMSGRNLQPEAPVTLSMMFAIINKDAPDEAKSSISELLLWNYLSDIPNPNSDQFLLVAFRLRLVD